MPIPSNFRKTSNGLSKPKIKPIYWRQFKPKIQKMWMGVKRYLIILHLLISHVLADEPLNVRFVKLYLVRIA